ncbi:MAG TPA: hypothetical protein VFT53_01635 [Candidatus Saccharimonadales bacterium]|nr:hypothetical protein [Candidatus Saccharimonadales bacterium]
MVVLIGALLVVIVLLAIDDARIRMADNDEKDKMVRGDNGAFQGSAYGIETVYHLESEEELADESESGSDGSETSQ